MVRRLSSIAPRVPKNFKKKPNRGEYPFFIRTKILTFPAKIFEIGNTGTRNAFIPCEEARL
nr:MAG TPA: hypothetical protein [Caudoviricetes sp.]